MNERPKLSEMLRNGKAEDLTRAWQRTEAAPELGPVPKGEYECAVLGRELVNSRTNNTPGYKLTLQVIAGPHAGRRVWKDYWLTDAALPMAKRDLAKPGIHGPADLDKPLPEGLIVRLTVKLRTNDSGQQYNEVTRLELVGVRKPKPAPFAPAGDLPEAPTEPAPAAPSQPEPEPPASAAPPEPEPELVAAAAAPTPNGDATLFDAGENGGPRRGKGKPRKGDERGPYTGARL
jgi:hypothetical protein